MPMTDLTYVLKHKLIEAAIEDHFICAKRPGFFAKMTLEDKKTLLALCQAESEATKFYQAEYERLNPKKTKKSKKSENVNYPAEASAAAKAAGDAKWAFLKAM